MSNDLYRFGPNSDTTSSPARNALMVTPSDTVDLINVTKALYIGGTGDVTVIMLDGSAPQTFSACPVGMILPVRCTRILATGTTATKITAFY